MNKFTADFHQGTFPGVTISKTYQEIVDNFWYSTDIPFIETDFVVDVSAAYRWLVENDNRFEQRHTQIDRMNYAKTRGHDWFIDPHSHGWDNLYIIGKDYLPQQIISNGEGQPQQHQTINNPDALTNFRSQLEEQHLPISQIVIYRLEPGGWVQPHIDKKVEGTPIMNHIWMPLHDFATSLKVYPCGYIKHQTGRAYILNNNNYPHSVINTDSHPRYVATMKIDFQQLPDNSWKKIQKSLQQQWFS